eukprot:2369123-Amphidinium_carterae.1
MALIIIVGHVLRIPQDSQQPFLCQFVLPLLLAPGQRCGVACQLVIKVAKLREGFVCTQLRKTSRVKQPQIIHSRLCGCVYGYENIVCLASTYWNSCAFEQLSGSFFVFFASVSVVWLQAACDSSDYLMTVAIHLSSTRRWLLVSKC